MHTVESSTRLPNPLCPHAHRLRKCSQLLRKLGAEQRTKLVVCAGADHGSDYASRGGTSNDTWEEIGVEERFSDAEMICLSNSAKLYGYNSDAEICHPQYPKEAPPDKQRALVPRLTLMLLKKRRFSSLVNIGVSRMYINARSCSSTYASTIFLVPKKVSL